MARHQVTVDDATEAVLERAAAHDGYNDVTHMLRTLALMQAERQLSREGTSLSTEMAELSPEDREAVKQEIQRRKGKK